jgi:hypothetical protein
MRTRFWAVLACGTLAAGSFISSPPSTQAADNAAAKKPDPMAALARFVGEWQTEGKWFNGEKLQARSIYDWGLGKKILKAKTFVMNGDKEYQRYEGIMAWHSTKKCLYEITFAFDGHISEELIEPQGDDVLNIGYTPFDRAEPANLRQIIKFTDKDHFIWTVSMKQGKEWKQLIEATWVRKSAKSH